MRHLRTTTHLLLVVFLLAVPFATAATESREDDAIPGVDTDSITLPRSIYVHRPDGEPIRIAAGRIRVQTDTPKSLRLTPDEGQDILVPAEPGLHTEIVIAPTAIYVVTDEGRHHIVLLLPDRKSLEVIGADNEVVPRGMQRVTPIRLSTSQVSTAYQSQIQSQLNLVQSAPLSREYFTTMYVWNLSQFDVNQVWLVRYEPVPGQDVGNKVATLITGDLSNAVPCEQRSPTSSYNDRIEVSVPIRHERGREPDITPYYTFDYIQERLCSNGNHLYWGDINAPNGGGYVSAESAKPIPSKAFAPGVVDVEIQSGNSFVNLPGYRLMRETIFIFDASGYPSVHTRHEQALCGPDGKVYLYRKPYPTYFIGHTEYQSGPIPLEIVGSYMYGYYDNINCD